MRATKKVLAVVLTLALLMAFAPFTAQASALSLSLELPSVTEAGDTIDATASLTANPGVASMRYTLSYHSSLELVSVTDGGICGSFLWSDDPAEGVSDRTSGVCSLVWHNPAADTDYSSTGTLVTLRFHVKADAEPGSLFVRLTGEEAWDHNLNPVSLSSAAAYTQILSEGNVYRLFVSESAENDTQRDGSLEHPYFYLVEALTRVKADIASIGAVPVEILLTGRVLDRPEATGQQLCGSSAPSVTLNGEKVKITVKSLHSDPADFATLVHNYTSGTGTLIGVNNHYCFENLNFTANGAGKAFYTNANHFTVGPNCNFYTNANGLMSVHGGGSSASAVYADPVIEIYSGSWDVVSLATTYRGKMTGTCTGVIGGTASVAGVYAGTNSPGIASSDSNLYATGTATFDSNLTVEGDAVVTNLYAGNSLANTYTTVSDFSVTVSGNASVSNLYTLGYKGTVSGSSVVRVNGGVVSNLTIGFRDQANGALDGTCRVIFTGGVTRDSITVQSGMSGLYTVEAELTAGDAVVVPQIDFDIVRGSVGKLILGDPSRSSFPVYSIRSTQDSPRIKFNTDPSVGQVLATLYTGATADSVRASTASGAAAFRDQPGDTVPVIVGGGVGVVGNTLVLDSSFGMRYLFDRDAVDSFSAQLGTAFTAQYSLDGQNFVQAEIELYHEQGATYYSFLVDGLSAKAVGDLITVSNSLSTVTDEYSIKHACLNVINAPEGIFHDEFVTLAKALLNYASAAQTHFEYRLDAPILDSYYEGIAYQAISDQSSVGNRSGIDVNVRATSLLLKDQVSMKFYFTLVNASLDVSSLRANFVCKGETSTATLTASGSYYTASVELPARDLREPVTVYVTNGSGDVISNRYTDSVASYCAFRLNTMNVQGTDRDVAEKLMAYVDSAIAYLNMKYPYSPDEDNLPPVFHR